jgi:hypothetical protein
MVDKGLFYLCIYNSEKRVLSYVSVCVVICMLVILHEDSVNVDTFSESSVAALSVTVQ